MTTDSDHDGARDGSATYATSGRHGFKRFFGAFLILLPLLVYYLYICATHYGGALVFPRTTGELWDLLSYIDAPSPSAVAFCAGWFLVQVLLQVYAPGQIVEGVPLADGSRLKYKMNGWLSWWVTLGLVALAVWQGWIPATLLADELGPLITTFNIVAFGVSLYLYFHGKSREPDLSTGRPVYDYFMGTSLNPRIGSFDFKLFFEARPGLILWVLINASLAAKQVQVYGTVTAPMLLVNAFQFLYIADYYFHEPAILTTMDIKHEKFGWMLCWGDIVWVPFTYTLQAQYLVDNAHELSVWATGGIVALNMIGYLIFRTSNLQKHRFRAEPERPIWGRKPEFIRTGRGTLLLTSGWWGLARHCNYAGDLLMGLAWCLAAGFDHIVPYFYIIYFTILLVHRERRDNEMCRLKYGGDWDAYCAKVRWRIFPGVY